MPLTGDRGLAGAFNAQVLRRAFALERQLRGEGKTVRWLVVGQEGRARRSRFRALRRSTRRGPASPTGPRYADAQAIAHRVAELYVEGEVDRVVARLQPLRLAARRRRSPSRRSSRSPRDVLETDEEERRDDALRGDFIFEPEPEEILERLLPVYLETELYRALLESAASEQGARMTAMRNASKNAGELIDSAHARR